MSQTLTPQSFGAMSGKTLRIPIPVTDRSGASVDGTGGTARFAMARDPNSTPVIDSAASPATATAAITTPNPLLITITVTDENTESLLGDYYYECEVTDSFGNESVVARGWITFSENLI